MLAKKERLHQRRAVLQERKQQQQLQQEQTNNKPALIQKIKMKPINSQAEFLARDAKMMEKQQLQRDQKVILEAKKQARLDALRRTVFCI